MSTIKVGENESVESALRRFKRKCSRDGIIGDMRKHEFYEAPAVKRRKKREAARKRNKNWLKALSDESRAGFFTLETSRKMVKNFEFKGQIMDDIILMARAAKKRMKTNFWADCKKNLDESALKAKINGVNEVKVKSTYKGKVKSEIKGEKDDEFYLAVKNILDSEGEVSDILGRLTDKAFYEKLSYEEKQRYNLELSSKYLAALKKYRAEKELAL